MGYTFYYLGKAYELQIPFAEQEQTINLADLYNLHSNLCLLEALLDFLCMQGLAEGFEEPDCDEISTRTNCLFRAKHLTQLGLILLMS